MEETKPLESLLTHTSKEPEAQVWAQIGTKAYDPPVKSTKVEDSPAKKPPSQENGTPGGASQAKESIENQEAPYFIDTGNSESEDPEEKMEEDAEAKKPKELPKSKSFTLGDGFVEPTTETEDTKLEDKEAKQRSRSRSRSRERKRSPTSKARPAEYTTNSSNPDDIKARVFVGHLSTDKCSNKEVDELFKPYGKILGVNLQDGYGFIQYEEEKSVKEAIKNVHGKMFHGDRLVVDRPVAMKKLEGAKRREHGGGVSSTREDLLEELEYYRRRERERHRYDDMYDRPGRRDWDRDYRPRPPMGPPLLPPHGPSYYGDYVNRGDRYGVGDMGYGRYGDESRFRGDNRYRDEPYRGDDRYSRSDPGRDPYDYTFNQRGNPYGDQYGKQLPRRM